MYSNGGHNLPYVLRKDGSLEMLPRMAGMALGVMEDIPYVCASVQLDHGDSLVMYTDGVTEAMNQAGEQFEEERLEKTLTGIIGKTAREEVDLIFQSTREFVNGAKQSDDITIVVLQFLGGK